MQLKKTHVVHEDVKLDGRSMFEGADCTVRATAAATGLPYKKVHEAFAKAGRKKGRGCNHYTQEIAWRILGYTAETTGHKAKAKTLGTLQRLLEKYDDTAPLLVYTRGHLTAFVNTRCTEHLRSGVRIRRTKRLVKIVVDTVNR